MPRARWFVVVVFVVFALIPSQAQAAAGGGWWDWLEALSGPGPFTNGLVWDLRIACRVRDAVRAADATGESTTWASLGTKACRVHENDVRSYVEIRTGWISTDADRPMFSDRPGEFKGKVTAHAVQANFMRQFDPAFAVGVGVGTIWFSGDHVEGTPAKVTFTPVSLAFMPLKLFLPGRHAARAGALVIRAEQLAIVGRMKASDFNRSSTSDFETGQDLVGSVSVTLDVLALIGK